MALSSYKTFLMHKKSSNFEKLVDIKDFPDIGGTPEMLQTTTLSNRSHTYIPGIDNAEALEFTVNFDKTDYATLKALKGKKETYAIWLGGAEDSDGSVTPTGSEGKFDFDGYLNVIISGAGVNEVVDMKVSIAPASEIRETAASG